MTQPLLGDEGTGPAPEEADEEQGPLLRAPPGVARRGLVPGVEARGGEARFNIPGPDMGPTDFDALLERLGGRLVALVNTTSASGPFLPVLSGPERAVITATRSDAAFRRREREHGTPESPRQSRLSHGHGPQARKADRPPAAIGGGEGLGRGHAPIPYSERAAFTSS